MASVFSHGIIGWMDEAAVTISPTLPKAAKTSRTAFRSADRGVSYPDFRNLSYGFRVAVSLSSKAP
jgi:hypothetical protein